MAHPHPPSQAMRLPFHARPRQPRLALRRAVRLLAGVLFIAAPLATATEPLPGGDVESIHAWLIGHNPELRALALEADAAQARIQPAGALPDPTVSLRLGGLDAGRPWRDSGIGSETTVSVRQQLPLWGKRDLARTSARQEAEASGFERDAALRDLFARAESALVRYWHRSGKSPACGMRWAPRRSRMRFARRSSRPGSGANASSAPPSSTKSWQT